MSLAEDGIEGKCFGHFAESLAQSLPPVSVLKLLLDFSPVNLTRANLILHTGQKNEDGQSAISSFPIMMNLQKERGIRDERSEGGREMMGREKAPTRRNQKERERISGRGKTTKRKLGWTGEKKKSGLEIAEN